ncbi:uncharacterized protein V1516DRAFT_622603 [Lipomyces oligophaga]|uniref:uncharacterized protein n=1 Tax=Lipomyces oligophaga TaxID=45792 RepID=UPI0034CF6DD6
MISLRSALGLVGVLLTASLPVLGSPSLDFPISEQYPPVARLNKAYSFTLSSNTFTTSSEGSLSYSASQLPSWLSFDDSSLVFSGTPSSDSDLGYPVFTITATDSADSSNTTDEATLVVVSSTSPSVAISCAEQLQENFTTYAADGISLPAGSTFTLAFSAGTFKGNVSAIYGLSSGNSPLPNWISFGESDLTFYGTTPSLSSTIAPPLSFDFVMVASDVDGFSAVSSPFSISIADHSLAAVQSSASVNATENTGFSTSLNVTLDDISISSSNISSVVVNGTESWMDFDKSTLTLSGTPDSNDVGESSEVVVTVTDVYGDAVTLTLSVFVVSNSSDTDGVDEEYFFTESLGNLTASRGKYFQYQLPVNSSDTDISEVSVAFEPSESWLSYDSSNYTLSGTVPATLSSVKVSVTVKTTDNDKHTAAMFYINGKGHVVLSTSTSSHRHSATSRGLSSSTSLVSLTTTTSSASTTSSSITTAAATNAVSKSSSNHKAVAIACGVVIPLAIILAALLLYYCFCFAGGAARNRRSRSSSSATAVSPTNSNISKPYPISPGPLDNWPHDNPHSDKTKQPARAWDGVSRRLSNISAHRRSYSDLEKEPHSAVGGFVIPYDPDDLSRPKKSHLFSGSRGSSHRDSLASLATCATNEIFSMRRVESSNGDISGLARNQSLSSTHTASEGGISAPSTGTIGRYSTSSSSDQLGSVREEDIGDHSDRIVRVGAGIGSMSSASIGGVSNSDESTSQRFELVPGSGREWRERRSSGRELTDSEPRLVPFRNGGLPARRQSASDTSMSISHAIEHHSAEAEEDDGQVFL